MAGIILADDLTAEWRQDWLSASVVDQTIVTDLTIQQPSSSNVISAKSLADSSKSMSCSDRTLPAQLP